MKPNKKFIAIAIVTILCIGCKEMANNKSANNSEANIELPQIAKDEISNNKPELNASSLAAKPTEIDKQRKLVRTADIKFKVQNVYKTTMAIEDITMQQKGFVTLTKLTSIKDKVDVTALSADSSLETIYYTTTNNITIRVPNNNLDSTLKEITTHVNYLDYRVIKAEDKTLKYISNNFADVRNANSASSLENATASGRHKLEDIRNAEEAVANKVENSDLAKIDNMDILDKVKYSVINIELYQQQTIARTILPNYKNIDGYQPSVFSKILSSIKTGWYVLEAIIVSLFKLWAFFLLGFVGYIFYKRYFKGLFNAEKQKYNNLEN